jgi:hypothetical protein
MMARDGAERCFAAFSPKSAGFSRRIVSWLKVSRLKAQGFNRRETSGTLDCTGIGPGG